LPTLGQPMMLTKPDLCGEGEIVLILFVYKEKNYIFAPQ
jgi:hypothetical protein